MSLTKLSMVLSSANVIIDASNCSVKIFEDDDCESASTEAEEFVSGSLINSVSRLVWSTWRSDETRLYLAPFTPKCIAILGAKSCSVSIAARTTGEDDIPPRQWIQSLISTTDFDRVYVGMLAVGMLLIFASRHASRNIVFFYSSGTMFGVLIIAIVAMMYVTS